MPLQIESKPWRGQTNWQCPFCAHATIGRKADMEAHIASRHPNQLRTALVEQAEEQSKAELDSAAEAAGVKPAKTKKETAEAVADAELASGTVKVTEKEGTDGR